MKANKVKSRWRGRCEVRAQVIHWRDQRMLVNAGIVCPMCLAKRRLLPSTTALATHHEDWVTCKNCRRLLAKGER